MAANYATAAVGTETSGSILSPSGKNSVSGLKPTVGLLSRGGIVPISGTYDTPGPITRNLIDNAILLSAMTGEDKADPVTLNIDGNKNYWEAIKTGTLKGLRFGIIKPFLKDSLYKLSVERIVQNGGIAIEFEPEQANLESFTRVLSADMKVDLPNYIKQYASDKVTFHSVSDLIDFNNKDSLKRIPYGQTLFAGIVKEVISKDDLAGLKEKLRKAGIDFFEKPMADKNLDVILSISNRNAGAAAVAHYPCLTVPMGFTKAGEPSTLTFIARPFEEEKLYKIGYAYEVATRFRRAPAE